MDDELDRLEAAVGAMTRRALAGAVLTLTITGTAFLFDASLGAVAMMMAGVYGVARGWRLQRLGQRLRRLRKAQAVQHHIDDLEAWNTRWERDHARKG